MDQRSGTYTSQPVRNRYESKKSNMEKLRIHRTKYRNRGQADKKLKGQNEHHVIFKFDTEEKAKYFTVKVKEFWDTLKGEPIPAKDVLAAGKKALLHDETKTVKDELPKIEVKKIVRKRPGPQKGKGGRPVKKNIQG